MDKQGVPWGAGGYFKSPYPHIASLESKYRITSGSRSENRRKKGRKDTWIFLARSLQIHKSHSMIIDELPNDLWKRNTSYFIILIEY